MCYKALFSFSILCTLALFSVNAGAQVHFQVVDSILVGGSGGWDYIAFDNGMLYASHNDEVVVVNAGTKQLVAHIPAHGSHGTAIARKLGRGFISNGHSNTVTAFDLNTNTVIKEVKVGDDPDAIAFDSATNRVFAMNGHGESVTAVDASTLNVVGTIALKGSPEFAVADGKGHLYLNIEDKNETIEIDTKKLKILKRWKLVDGDGPTGLALDKKHELLFSGCHNQKLFMLSAKTGTIVDTAAIGAGVDATAFDAGLQLAFASNRDGTLNVFRERPSAKLELVQNVTTEPGAKTMALDPETHTVYLPTASFGDTPAATTAQPHPRPSVIDGTFRILIVRNQ